MKEINELNSVVLEACNGMLAEEGILSRGPKDVPKELELLPEEIRGRIREFRGRLHAAMPDDFSYILVLGESEPSFRTEYDNGITHGGSRAVCKPDGVHVLNAEEAGRFLSA